MSHNNNTSTSSGIEIFETLQNDTDHLQIVHIAESTLKANALIDKLEQDESNIFTPPNTDISQHLDRVLRAMLQCGTDNEGKIYAIKTLLLCEKWAESQALDGAGRQKEIVLNLRAVGVIWLTHFLFVFKADARNSGRPVRTSDHEQVLKRDGHVCLLTHTQDVNHPSNSGWRTLDICQILKRVVDDDISTDLKKQLRFRSATGTFDILRNYSRFDSEMFDSLVDSPCNALTFNCMASESFDNYHFCFKKVSNSIPHEYALNFFYLEVFKDMDSFHRINENGQPLPPNIIFENHHGPDSDMPNEIFLEIHAIVASVLHMSGADRFFNDLFRRYPPSRSSRPILRWVDMERHIEVYDLTAQQMPKLGLEQGMISPQ